MRTVDLIAGAGLLIFCTLLAFVVIPAENSEGVWYGLSPYFYPMVMIAGVALSSIGLLAQAATKPKLYEDQPNPLTWWQLGCFALVCVIILAGVLAIDWFGVWIGGPLLIAAVMLFMGERDPLRILPVSLITVAIVYAIVTYGLRIPLP